MQLPSERLKRKVEKENLWIFVLSTLRRGAHSGSEIKTLVTKRFGFLTGNVTVYKVLYLLEKGGHVRSRRDGRSVVYTITQNGSRELGRAKRFLQKISRTV